MLYKLPLEVSTTTAMALGAHAGDFEEVLLSIMHLVTRDDPYDDTELSEVLELSEGALTQAYESALATIRELEPTFAAHKFVE